MAAPIPFANYEPDRGTASGAGQIAKGVLSASGRYVPLKGLEVYRAGSSLNDYCLGGAGFYDSTGQPATFVGDAGRLYRLVARVITDVSQTGGYAADPDWQWSFEQFGNNILAAARGVTLQKYVLGSSSRFADIAGAPTAEVLFRVRSHMFACSGRTVNWSAFNDIDDWSPDPATQAGNTTVGQDAGIIVSGIGGEQGALFQERGIIRIGYQGGDIPWILDEVEGGRGACSPASVRRWGRGAFVAAEDGFYFWDGLNAQPIGQDKVDRTFSQDLNYPYRGRVTTAIDTESKSWMVAYPGGSSTHANKVLIYSWADNRWTHDEIDVQALFELPRDGVSADDSAAITAIAGTDVADSIMLSADSPAWRESRRTWVCVDTSRTVKTFTGSPRAGTMETGEVAPVPSGQTYVSEIYPITDAEPGNVSLEVYTKQYRLGETAALADTADMNEVGCCDVRAEGRYIKGRVNIRAGAPWTEATGITWNGAASSER
jgi:hypothetical protein